MGGIGYASKHDTTSDASAGQTPAAGKTSAPPAAPGPVPMPYPNMAVSPYGNADQQERVKAMQKSSTNVADSAFDKSAGDEAGSMKGIQSAATASTVPEIHPTAPVDTSAMTGTNGKPSQTKVKVGP